MAGGVVSKMARMVRSREECLSPIVSSVGCGAAMEGQEDKVWEEEVWEEEVWWNN